jgi:hypothetical protein
MRTTPTDDFFKVGGALDPDALSYVTYQANEDLMWAMLSDQHYNLRTVWKMGRSR